MGFRECVPALKNAVWLDTPGSPPAATPVTRVLQQVLSDWESGDFDWQDWNASAARTQDKIARLSGLPNWGVATVASTAEGVSTVAAAHPTGEVVVLSDEFQSSLLPWSTRASDELRIHLVERTSASRTDDLLSRVTSRTTLVSVSHVNTLTGEAVDLMALRHACDEVGARLLVNVTQSLGALKLKLSEVQPDFVVVHGYKWLLAPRGIAWLIVRPDREIEVRPPSPGWTAETTSTSNFGDPYGSHFEVKNANGSTSWFSALGAEAALDLMLQLDQTEVDYHVRYLADRFRDGLRELGIDSIGNGTSHIVVSHLTDTSIVQRIFKARKIRALITPERFRVGFHFYNDEADVDTALDAISQAFRHQAK